MRATPLPQDDNGAAASSAGDAGFQFGGALRHGLSRALPGPTRGRSSKAGSGLHRPFVGSRPLCVRLRFLRMTTERQLPQRVTPGSSLVGALRHGLSRALPGPTRGRSSKAGSDLHRSLRLRSGQALRRKSPAMRATPLPQDDNGTSAPPAAKPGSILAGLCGTA